jgi:hypothetical protein
MKKKAGQTPTLREINETIIDAIRRCPNPASGEIFRLFQLIKETRIPKGHNDIVVAIDRFFDFPGAEKYARERRLVKDSLIEQETTAEKEAKEMARVKKQLKRELKKLDRLISREVQAGQTYPVNMTRV